MKFSKRSETSENEPLDYTFSTEDTTLESLIDDMKSGSRGFDDNDFEDTPINTNDFEVEVEEEDLSPTEKQQLKDTAEFLVSSFDRIASSLLAGYAHANVNDFQTNSKDLKKAAVYFQPYLVDSGLDLPNWAKGAFVLASVYSVHLKQAGSLRKANIKAEKAEARFAEMNERNKELELQIREKELLEKNKGLQKELDNE